VAVAGEFDIAECCAERMSDDMISGALPTTTRSRSC
jgi:hypothetical protein